MNSANQFLHHILNTPSLQADMQARLLMGHNLETVVITTTKNLGYAVTFADITAVLDNNPALANKIMALLPAPLLELDEAQLEMIAGGGIVGTCAGGLSCVPGGGSSLGIKIL